MTRLSIVAALLVGLAACGGTPDPGNDDAGQPPADASTVDASTGEYRWHFKETPEDRWDFDSDAQITLADMVVNGQKRHVALHAPKNGYFYVLDAKTGQFLSAGSIVPQNWTTGIDPKTGQAKVNPEALYDKSGKPFVGMPGAMGAEWW